MSVSCCSNTSQNQQKIELEKIRKLQYVLQFALNISLHAEEFPDYFVFSKNESELVDMLSHNKFTHLGDSIKFWFGEHSEYEFMVVLPPPSVVWHDLKGQNIEKI